jgi:uncharacterized RDD family membrane protein YckC
MFNPLVMGYLNNPPFKRLGLGKRLNGSSSELLYPLSVLFPIVVALMIPGLNSEHSPIEKYDISDALGLFGFSLLMFALINKDFFGGQSVVKRMFGFRVVDVRTLEPASEFKCMIRNVTAPMWPIEAIVLLISPQRRIGDFIAGTKVVKVDASDPQQILQEITKKKVDSNTVLTLLTSLVVLTVYALLFDPKVRLW